MIGATIWKYTIDLDELLSKGEIAVPITQVVLRIVKLRLNKDRTVDVWVAVDKDVKTTVKNMFLQVFGTGHDGAADRLPKRYIDTIFDGDFVWHIWERV